MGSQHNVLSIETAYGVGIKTDDRDRQLAHGPAVGIGMSGVLPTHAMPRPLEDKPSLLRK